MPLHTSHTLLKATPQEAFDYLTIPACWHEWHAASLGTTPDWRVSQPKGATFDEDIYTAGFRRRLHWRVVDVRRPQYWEAQASMDDGSSVRLCYEFIANGSGTTFTRTLTYHVKPWWLRAIDTIFGRFKIRLETASALLKLRQRFERQSAEVSAVAREP